MLSQKPLDGNATLGWAAQLAKAVIDNRSPSPGSGGGGGQQRSPYTVKDHADLIELTRRQPIVYEEHDPLSEPHVAYSVARVLGYLPGVHTAALEPASPPAPTSMRELLGRERPVHSPLSPRHLTPTRGDRKDCKKGSSPSLRDRLEFAGSPPPKTASLTMARLPTVSLSTTTDPHNASIVQGGAEENAAEEYEVKVITAAVTLPHKNTPQATKNTSTAAIPDTDSNEPEEGATQRVSERVSSIGAATLAVYHMVQWQKRQLADILLRSILQWRAEHQVNTEPSSTLRSYPYNSELLLPMS